MKAIVVYESHWGNTEAIARAVASGFGPDAEALTTDEASDAVLTGVDLVVVGAPLIAFALPSETTRRAVAAESAKAPTPPDLSHPSLSSWLDALPRGHGRSASFETRMRWSPGGATGAIDRGLAAAGYRSVGKGRRFVVKGKYGPLRDGEIEHARQWGAELAETLQGNCLADTGLERSNDCAGQAEDAVVLPSQHSTDRPIQQ
jgi:hypothetical protein